MNDPNSEKVDESVPFKDTGLSFASVASAPESLFKSPANFGKLTETSASELPSFSSPNISSPQSFFGLSKSNDFSSFSGASNVSANKSTNGDANESAGGVEDANYDPHYDPIIALPDEIVVSTGEEEEEKIFGERAKLYRYDATLKEWKERGKVILKCFIDV